MVDGSGTDEVLWTDVLRGAVVLVHASLEDLLRSLAEWKLPAAPPEVLESIPLESIPLTGAGDARRTRFGMPELARHRGKPVDEVVTTSVEDHLQRATYGHPGEVKRLLVSCGGDPNVVDSYSRWLGPMMARRHWIVHEADAEPETDAGDHHQLRRLRRDDLATWVDGIENLGRVMIGQFR